MKAKAGTKSYKSFNTLKQYVTLDSTDYWHLQYDLNDHWSMYYWDLRKKAELCELDRDENGVMLYQGEDGNTYYSQIEITQYSLACYQMFKTTGQKKWLDECLLHVDFIKSNEEPFKQASYALLNRYPVSLYGIDDPWPSAMAYGLFISMLVRLYKEFEKKDYLEDAKKYAVNFEIPVEDGGVRRLLENHDIVILEEYTSDHLSGVLNGHIMALWGLYDLSVVDSSYEERFTTLVDQLAKNLDLWTNNFWSYYDNRHLIGEKPNLASIHYHMLHIKQLQILYKITGKSIFANYAEHFIRHKYSIISRFRAFTNKVLFRLRI